METEPRLTVKVILETLSHPASQQRLQPDQVDCPKQFLGFSSWSSTIRLRSMIMSGQWLTLLVLGRVAGLPVVWSNGLAGWCLGGGGNWGKLLLLLVGLSALHLGGAFLNDACDTEIDQRRRPGRPIPSGKISRHTVWRYGLGLMGFSLLPLLFCGKTAILGTLFAGISVLLFNYSHQWLNAAPWLLAMGRFWIYIVGGATASAGVNGDVIFCGAALALYVAGSGHVTRHSLARRTIPLWATLLLVAPVVMAALLNTGEYFRSAIVLSIPLLVWLGYCLRKALFPADVNARWAAANLFAGIVLVDWLAVGPIFPIWAGIVLFGALLGLTKSLQNMSLSV